MKIAVIGSGISGLSLAWMLQEKHNIALFEQNNYLGGHSNTAEINYNGTNIAVDTGFIVFNHKTYPNLVKLFQHFGVETKKSNMSFGVKCYDSNLEYSGANIAGVFAQKSNCFKPSYLKMLYDINKFNKNAINFVENKNIENSQTLEEFVASLNLGKYFKEYYLFPMAAAIWSCPLETIKNYPAKTFLQFFYNHGLLTITQQPQWYTVSGGSKNYVKKIASTIKNIKLNTKITKCIRKNNVVFLEDTNGNSYEFDHVVFASHPNQTMEIVKDFAEKEKDLFAAIQYNNNTAVLHCDTSQMPKTKNAWASWCYLSSKKENKVSLTYWMNNLQNIDSKLPVFVTLNPFAQIEKSKIFGVYEYEHPVFTQSAINAQENFEEIQGLGNIWHCGAWLKYGFHEDGLNSAINIAKQFDCIPECLK